MNSKTTAPLRDAHLAELSPFACVATEGDKPNVALNRPVGAPSNRRQVARARQANYFLLFFLRSQNVLGCE